MLKQLKLELKEIYVRCNYRLRAILVVTQFKIFVNFLNILITK